MSKRIGRVTYECRYVIIEVPDDWTIGTPLPPPGPTDQWFDHAADFIAALGGPFDHKPINRRPWEPEQPEPASLVRSAPARPLNT